MMFTTALFTLSLLALFVKAAPAAPAALEKRTPRQSFVGCTASPLDGDTLVTPPSPDGCAVCPCSYLPVCMPGLS